MIFAVILRTVRLILVSVSASVDNERDGIFFPAKSIVYKEKIPSKEVHDEELLGEVEPVTRKKDEVSKHYEDKMIDNTNKDFVFLQEGNMINNFLVL